MKKRTYKLHTPEATRRHNAAAQYNWAILRLRGALTQFADTHQIAKTIKSAALRKGSFRAEKEIRATLDILLDPDTRKAWMKEKVPTSTKTTKHATNKENQ